MRLRISVLKFLCLVSCLSAGLSLVSTTSASAYQLTTEVKQVGLDINSQFRFVGGSFSVGPKSCNSGKNPCSTGIDVRSSGGGYFSWQAGDYIEIDLKLSGSVQLDAWYTSADSRFDGLWQTVTDPTANATDDSTQITYRFNALVSQSNGYVTVPILVSSSPTTVQVMAVRIYRPVAQQDLSGIQSGITNVNNNLNKLDSSIKQSQDQAHEDSQKLLEEQKKQTDFITSTDSPNADEIASEDSIPSVGLLPPGPLDSILLLPVNLLNSIIQSFGGTCSSISAPLPYVNESISFLCFSDTIYSGDFSILASLIGSVASAFILFYYLKHLYKKVDRATSLDTDVEDEWGIL